MSVINSMLRDLDRRHAPLPINTNVQASPISNSRLWPRSALVLCTLIIFAAWGWHRHAEKNAIANITAPIAEPVIAQTEKIEIETESKPTPIATQIAEPAAAQPDVAVELASIPVSTDAPAIIDSSTPQTDENKQTEISENHEAEIVAAEKPVTNSEAQNSASIIKQERKAPEDLNYERYQLARAALAQNQPQRAYELLRDSPPPIASATDYHAVLAAIEQQLGHYADASLRYQQLLQLDQNQASWWLGLALSFEGEHRNNDALAAYGRAAALNALPDAARQYVTARIAALDSITGQVLTRQ